MAAERAVGETKGSLCVIAAIGWRVATYAASIANKNPSRRAPQSARRFAVSATAGTQTVKKLTCYIALAIANHLAEQGHLLRKLAPPEARIQTLRRDYREMDSPGFAREKQVTATKLALKSAQKQMKSANQE
jgi:hypothetical protein